MDPCGGTDPLGMFPLFLKKTADVMGPRLSVVFRRLVRLGSFSACWRQANVTPISKDPPSSSVPNYRPSSITSVLSKVFERFVFVWGPFLFLLYTSEPFSIPEINALMPEYIMSNGEKNCLLFYSCH